MSEIVQSGQIAYILTGMGDPKVITSLTAGKRYVHEKLDATFENPPILTWINYSDPDTGYDAAESFCAPFHFEIKASEVI